MSFLHSTESDDALAIRITEIRHGERFERQAVFMKPASTVIQNHDAFNE